MAAVCLLPTRSQQLQQCRFHSPAALAPVMVGCGLLSLAYLLTASPLAAVGGHILLHTALNLRGTEMPPYATGGVHIVPLGHQRPVTKTAVLAERR